MFNIFKSSNYQIIISKSLLLAARELHKRPIPIPVAWTRPEFGWTKLNFDGSSKGEIGPGVASIGGVLRDHKAQFLLGYAESIGRAYSSMAELKALTKGLELVLENGWKDVWVEGDAKGLVEILAENREVKCMEARSYLRHIKSLLLDFDNCKVSHIYREGNKVADRFASIGHRCKKLEIWRELPPLETLDMMRHDAEGKITFRRR
uniref:RNase H type-1 domain-containing protein n=1 Tax=Cucumis sativus TaxID=3659 RepID=A0A0A0LUF5_CUCSA